MNDWYFYRDSGKTVGPFSADMIRERIKDGRIRVLDMIYKDGEPAWRMALEHPPLRSEFNSATLSSLKERPWILLQRKAGEELDFLTTGPFTQEEIRGNLLAGSVAYSDYAWKDNFAEWKRIGALEEFNSRARPGALPPVPSVPQESGADLLKNVVEITRPKIKNYFVQEAEEAAHVDFAAIPPPLPPAGQTVVSEAARAAFAMKSNGNGSALDGAAKGAAAVVDYEARERRRTERKRRAARSQILMDWSLVIVLMLILAAGVVIVSRVFVSHNTPPPPPEVATANEAIGAPGAAPGASQPGIIPQQVVPGTAQIAEPGEPLGAEESAANPQARPVGMPPPGPQKPPHEMRVHVLAGSPPRIDIRSDASKDYPVYLQIVGLPGQVNDGGAFYRFMKVPSTGKIDEPLNLSALKLPQGKFILRAESGDIKKESRMAWGLNEPQFKQTIGRQRKTWAYAIWQERLALFRLSSALEKQLSLALVPTKKFSSKPWEALINLKRSEGGKHLMFEDWWELHNIAKDAKAEVNGALVARAQRERDHLAAFSVWK